MNDVVSYWDKAARVYKEKQEQSSYVAINKKIVQKRFSNLNNKKVLDMGCGYGNYTDYFNEIGADVIGIDASCTMLEMAKQNYPNCHFKQMDITKPIAFDDNTFDIIFCNQVLMDIENIEFIFSECSRLLKVGGIFYYTIVHPAFYDGTWLKDKDGFAYAKFLDKYLSSYELTNEFWGTTAHFHRPLSYYLNLASKNNFCLIHTEEPVIYDGTTKNKEIPLFFVAEYRKID